MLEAESYGVQPLPLEPDPLGQDRVRAVGEVADARMLERAHVDADLVGATGLEVDLEEAGEAVSLERRVVGDAVPAIGHDGHLVVVLRVAPDRSVDGALERI